WSGEFISAIGSGLTSFGLGIFVYKLTGNAISMTLVTLLGFLPSLLLSAPSGVLADRYDRRLLMILGDSLSAIGIVLILVFILINQINLAVICIGVFISSVFSSLMAPAYKATVSDLLTKEQYAKASGLVQIADSSKYLIAPLLAGFLLTISDIKLLLIIDISTFFITVSTTTYVRKGLVSKKSEVKTRMIKDLVDGWKYLSSKKGVLILLVVTSIINFFMGFIQTLSIPMVLAITNEAALGTLETIITCGMLVSSILIGSLKIKGNYVRMLWIALAANGIAMFLYGSRPNLIFITITGFLFFATLPFANTSIECLIRSNIDNEMQGRAWGLITIISELGCVFSYAIGGPLADFIFTPGLSENGFLADNVGRFWGTGDGRGCGFLISICGILIVVMALILSKQKKVRELEDAVVLTSDKKE
ncbi:MAG: MFS transporter, partial [Treponema sp.]|nr:MFS transporter [Treponema sp.]